MTDSFLAIAQTYPLLTLLGLLFLATLAHFGYDELKRQNDISNSPIANPNTAKALVKSKNSELVKTTYSAYNQAANDIDTNYRAYKPQTDEAESAAHEVYIICIDRIKEAHQSQPLRLFSKVDMAQIENKSKRISLSEINQVKEHAEEIMKELFNSVVIEAKNAFETIREIEDTFTNNQKVVRSRAIAKANLATYRNALDRQVLLVEGKHAPSTQTFQSPADATAQAKRPASTPNPAQQRAASRA